MLSESLGDDDVILPSVFTRRCPYVLLFLRLGHLANARKYKRNTFCEGDHHEQT